MTEPSKKPIDPKDNLIPFTKENAAEMARRSHASRKQRALDAAALLMEAGFPDPDDAPPALQKLAEKAAGSSANASDMRLFLQQAGLMKKGVGEWDGEGPCPTCGLDPTEGLMIGGEDLDEMERNLDRFEELLRRSEQLQVRLSATRD